MKDCKFCQAEINDEDRVCPVCGKEQDAAAQSGAVETAPQDIPGEDAAQEEAAVAFPAEEAAVAEFSEEESAPEDPPAGEAPAEEAPAAQAHKVSPGKLALATAAVVVLAALLIALVMAGMQDAGTAAGETTAPELSATQPATEVTTAPTTPATIPADGNPDACRRYYFNYETPLAGQGHFIHTYMGDGNPLPSFEGEPEQIAITSETPQEFAQLIWDNLNEENKVSLFVRYIDIMTGSWETVILNKHEA